jgi:transcriptional regulator with XRE-family HTH domain
MRILEGAAAPTVKTPGGRLTLARQKRGMFQKELAEAAEVGEAHLSMVETNRRPIDTLKVGTLVRICDALDLSLDYVVRGEQKPAA